MSSCIGCSQGEVLASPEAGNAITCNLSNADTRESLLTLGGFVSPRPHLHSYMAELKRALHPVYWRHLEENATCALASAQR